MPQKIVKKIDTFFSETNYNAYLSFMKSLKVPYRRIETNYTCLMQTNNGEVSIYLKESVRNVKAFIGFNLIKKDIAARELVAPEIPRDELRYFKFSIPDRLKQSKRTVYKIDIKSAYANVLKNHGIISDKTHGYICKQLKKEDRLAAVGMLASKKHILDYNEKDEATGYDFIESPLSNFFYFCVWQTGELMERCRELIGADFLFYWVDGIYFENKKHAAVLTGFLKKQGYNCSFDELRDFTVVEKEKKYSIVFKELSKTKNDWMQKVFYIPKINKRIINDALTMLGLINQSKNESR